MQVGSISLMLQSDRQQAKSIRLKDLLLLLIRCLIIILLAVLLAKPHYTKPINLQNTKGWLLVEKGQVKVAYEQYKPLIDSLNNAGFAFHYFEDGFKELPFTKALQQVDTLEHNTQGNYWQLLAQLNQEVPAQLPVYIFTRNRLANLRGSRPKVNLDLNWLTINAVDSSSAFIANAYQNGHGQLALSTANSTRFGTSIDTRQLDPNALPSSLIYQRDSNMLLMGGRRQSKVLVDTSTLKVCIYVGKNSNDASYLKAAIDAIISFGDYKISYKIVKNTNDIPASIDWLFWLSDEPILSTIASKNIMHYAKGKEVNTASWLMMENDPNKQEQSINISKIIQPGSRQIQQTIWTDGYGNPILTEDTGNNNLYTFYSRFNPEWNGLVWNRYFPEMLLSLLYPDKNAGTNAADERVVERSQFLPVNITAATGDKQKFMQVVPLDKWFWLLAFLLFCVERLLSFINKKEALNG